MGPLIRQILRHWLPLAVVISGLSALVYVAGQQVLRLGGNDPQIQVAQDTDSRLTAGEPLASVAPTGTLEVATSLAPFTIVYDDQGTVLATSGLLHGQPPAVPVGVLDNARQNGENRLSWQPEGALRYAAVVERVAGAHPGFVLVARSLRETEQRIAVVEQLTLAGWLGTLLASLAAVVLVEVAVGRGKGV